MKYRFSVFFRWFFAVFICSHLFLYSANLSDCDTFLTCVKIPQNCQSSCIGTKSYGKTFFAIRPQDSNSALRIARVVNEDHLQTWGVNLTLGAQQSFSGNNNVLAKWFLFNGCDCVSVGIPDDTISFDVDGSQLGLLTGSGLPGPIGKLCLDPSLKNFNINLNAWFDLNKYVCGLWLRTYLTLVQAKTNLGMKSCTDHAARLGNYADGAFTTDCNESPIQYTSICQAFIGNQSFGNVPDLKYAKFYGDSKNKTALASIRFDLSYDVVKSVNGFFNCGGCVVIPTGNRSKGNFIFEPIVGANGSWQVGATILGAYNCLYSSEKDAIDFYVDATLTYLCKSKQTRVFPLKNNGAGSQYMLLKVFDLSVGAVIEGERVANIFAGQADIGANVMFDGSMLLHFERCNGLFFEVGYNLWVRSKENIANTVCLRNFTQNTYGIKGDLPLSKIDETSDLCIGDLTTATKSTLGHPAYVDATTMVLDVCDIDFGAALHPSAFSNKLFASLGYSSNMCRWESIINMFLEGEVEIGQKDKALNQWALNVNIGISL